MDTIGVCNMALTLLGANKILSLDDGTTASELCKQWLEPARDMVLESRDWTFASKRKRLPALVDAPVSEFEFQFLLPSDCLSIRAVCNNEDMQIPTEYQKEDNRILARFDPVWIRYTALITDMEQFPPGCYTALAHRLAQFLSGPLTGNKGLGDRLVVQSEQMVEDGGAIDGRQGSPNQVTSSQLLNARSRTGSMWHPYIGI